MPAMVISAQGAPVTPTPPPKIKEGYIRFWNMLPEETGSLALQQETGGEAEVVASAPPSNLSAGYIPMRPGRYMLKAVRSADPKTVLKTFDLVLRSDVYVTFLAQVKDHALSIEMVDDTYDRTKAITGRLTIRHFYPGAAITVTPTGGRTVGPLADGTVEIVDNLPVKPVLLRMKAAFAGGQSREWTTEVDFRNCRHVSLLLAKDPYGRFRPRTSPDGQVDFTEPPLPPQ